MIKLDRKFFRTLYKFKFKKQKRQGEFFSQSKAFSGNYYLEIYIKEVPAYFCREFSFKFPISKCFYPTKCIILYIQEAFGWKHHEMKIYSNDDFYKVLNDYNTLDFKKFLYKNREFVE